MGCGGSREPPIPPDPEIIRREQAIEQALEKWEGELRPLREAKDRLKEAHSQSLADATDRVNQQSSSGGVKPAARRRVSESQQALDDAEHRYARCVRDMRAQIAELRSELRDYIEEREQHVASGALVQAETGAFVPPEFVDTPEDAPAAPPTLKEVQGFTIGSEVRVHSLTSKPETNGKTGSVVGPVQGKDGTQRVQVRLDGVSISLKAANLEAV